MEFNFSWVDWTFEISTINAQKSNVFKGTTTNDLLWKEMTLQSWNWVKHVTHNNAIFGMENTILPSQDIACSVSIVTYQLLTYASDPISSDKTSKT